MNKPPLSRVVLLIILLLSAITFAIYQKPLTIDESPVTGQTQIQGSEQVQLPGTVVDDWQYKPQNVEYDNYGGLSYGQQAPGRVTGTAPKMAMMEAAAPTAGAGNIGFSVGGAKDINNFRENIANDYLPLPTDVTYEGLFYDYFFDTGATQPCDKLFCPAYSYAVTPDPVSEKNEYYLSVGLNSGIKETDFQRKKLNLMVVLDISGSMGSPFDEYYYDQFGNRQPVIDSAEKEETGKKKITVAAESINALLDHLNADDRFGMVVYDDTAALAKPLNLIGSTDMKKIKDHILELQERNSTNLSAGMDMASRQFREFAKANQNEYENRIIFLTDAQPNVGDTSDEGMFKQVEQNSDNNIYTTFIGIGVDFNTDLIERLTKVRGANYYSVHSSKEFKNRMDEGFDYMVTPLVFDLKLNLQSDGWEIDKVYGSPEADKATGEIMYVNTLFPSKTEGGQTKGGIVLLKLGKISSSQDNTLKLKVSYLNRMGQRDSSEATVTLPVNEGSQKEYFENSGIRKGVLLVRYANLLKDWLVDARINSQPRPIPMEEKFIAPPHPCLLVTRENGIIIPEPPFVPPCWPHPWPVLGEWERQSMPLAIDREYRILFSDFSRYFKSEMEAVGDKDLEKEVKVLDQLAK